MTKKEKNLIEIYRSYIPDIDATDEQIKFLLKEFEDEESIIGIHNTILGYKTFFNLGLRNSTWANQTYNVGETKELSNTVMYFGCLWGLLMCPNGDGKYREKTAIVLKIPKAVFEHKQGIFEILEDGTYGIPPQFIKAALYDGKVIENDSYDKKYYSEEAVICEDTVEIKDRKLQVKMFERLYYNNNKDKWINRIKRKIDIIKNKTKYLDEPKQREIGRRF